MDLYFSFVRKFQEADGSVSFYASSACGESKEAALKRVSNHLEAGKTLVDILYVGCGKDNYQVYEKACNRAYQLSHGGTAELQEGKEISGG